MEGVVVEQPAEATAGDRTAAATPDIAVEEGLEPPVPTAPGWHMLEENNGVKRWRAFDPEMQKHSTAWRSRVGRWRASRASR